MIIIPIIILIILFLLFMFFYMNNKNNDLSPNNKSKYIEVYTLDIENEKIPSNEIEQVYEINIAGISKYCDFSDIGIYQGIIFNQKDNEYNDKAMAIVNMDSKLFGYIPNNSLSKYYKWSSGKPVTCVIKIDEWVTEDGDIKIYGKVFAIKPYNNDFINKKTNEIIKRISK